MYSGTNNNHPHRIRRYLHRMTMDEGLDHLHHPPLSLHPHHDASSPDHHQPASASSLTKHIATSLMRHHQLSERNKHTVQPLSPASYGSSLEMTAYNPAATPSSSIELRTRIGDSNYSFKTSTELLKILNRIWSLEEQHTSNVSIVKALKNELSHARAKIKELLRDKQTNRHEMDELMKQISESNLARKSKEQERIDTALQSVQEELENERKLRKRSESLHRKLARELFEIKVSLSSTIKELEKQRKSTELLEQLCDEFAVGIGEYARQVYSIRQKSDEDWNDVADHDNLILHISESWLDERMQMKTRENSSIVDKLRPDIEAFLAVKTKDNLSPTNPKQEDCVSPDTHVEKTDPQNTPREIDDKITEKSMLQKSEIYDALIKEGNQQRKKGYNDEGHGSNSKAVDKLMSELLLSERGSLVPPEYDQCKEVSSGNSVLRRNASPVRQWMSNLKSLDAKNELKPKLQEPKSKGHRSRLKILRGSS